MKYVTIQEFRNFTNNQSSENSDVAVTDILDSAESYFEQLVGNRLFYDYGEVVELQDGNGGDTTFTQFYPLVSFDKLEIDDNSDGTFTEVAASDYHAFTETGKIVLKDNINIPLFYSYKQNVKLTYKPGFVTTPEFIKHIIIRMAANILSKLPILDNGIADEINSIRDMKIDLSRY
jgi:hypothetical protein